MFAHRVSSSHFFYSIFLVIWCFYSICSASATITSRTIDDTLGDLVTGQKVIYEPASAWQTFNDSFASGGTFTRAQSTGNISATLTFNGTAIYVFFMVPSDEFPHDIPFATSFSLDNGPPELFQPSPDLNAPLSNRDELVFSKTHLVATEHTLVISASPSENVSHIIDFDHAIYETDDGEVISPTTTPSPVQSLLPSPSPSQTYPMVPANAPQQPTTTSTKSSSGMVACGIIIAFLTVGGFAVTVFFLRRRRLRKRGGGMPSIEIDPAEDIEPDNKLGSMSAGEASMNPFDDNQAPEPTSASASRGAINVMGQLPYIYSNGIAYSDPPISSQSKVANSGIQPPQQNVRGVRGVPLQPLHIVNRASSSIPSATTATGGFSRQQILEEQLSAYLVMMQQKADEMSLSTDGQSNAAHSPERTEEEYKPLGYSQEKVKDPEEKIDEGDLDAWFKRMSDPDIGVEELKEMIYAMKLQIEALQAQGGVDQALSPFEDPPPQYTPAAPGSGRRMTNAGPPSGSPISPTVVDRWRSAVARLSRIGLGS
ncbi:hypothetical protein D9619_005248 [Psilocybe cf. subviscida]|uniref:Mid2 domain-containing protein n=1 Tax=Psilocybe cf. subviscida TaxID=2480587 RepID=A0A8H5FBR0_9AGAR|nr:hypothetical protein D9619_005248 [Psilocybe cf. subviscida]